MLWGSTSKARLSDIFMQRRRTPNGEPQQVGSAPLRADAPVYLPPQRFWLRVILCYIERMGWPTTANPKRQFVTLRLSDDDAADLDAAAATAGMSRSAYVRDCVRRIKVADAKKAARLKSAAAQEALEGAEGDDA